MGRSTCSTWERRSAAVAGLSLLAGCQFVVGLEDRQTDPTLYASDAGPIDAADAAPSPGCTLARKGAAKLRFGNVAAVGGAVEFCVKPSDAADYEPVPWSRGIGVDCPRGLGYAQVLAPVALEPGGYSIKTVQATLDCSAPAIAELAHVEARANETVTVLQLGGAARPISLGAFPETRVQTIGTNKVRFIHAIASSSTLEAGLADVNGWPSSMVEAYFHDVEYGRTAKEQTSDMRPVDQNGYLELWLGVTGARMTFGAAEPGSLVPSVIGGVFLADGVGATVIGIGNAKDPERPPAILACDDSATDGPWTRCAAESHPLRVTVWDAVLDGAYSPAFAQRRPYIMQALGKLDTDVICLANACAREDKEAAIAAARSAFPYSYYADQNMDTPTDDPADRSGKVPEPESTPACGTPEALEKAQAFIDCAVENCSSIPGSDAGHVTEGACTTSKCMASGFGIMAGGELGNRCYACVFAGLSGFKPFKDILQSCSTDPKDLLAFDGQNCQLMLSRFPLVSQATWTLPSTVWRISVSVAKPQLPNGATPDVYCTVMGTSVRSPLTQPYAGDYGDGADENPWYNEAELQHEKLLKFVRQRSGPTQAVIMGAFYTGPEYLQGDTQVLTAVSPDIFALLGSQLSLGVAESWPWACTECVDNAWNTSPSSSWTTHIWTSGIARGSVRDTRISLNEAVIPVPSKPSAPLSPRYALESVIPIVP